MSDKKFAIVTDGLWRKSLSAIRSLGKQGYTVTVLGDSYLTTGFWSKYTARRVVMPTAAAQRDVFGKALAKELQNPYYTSKPVLLPMEDATMLWLSENRDSMKQYADFLIPDHEALLVAEDKGQTVQLAKKLGIDHPKTLHPKNVSDAWKMLQHDARYPCVVKPIEGSGSSGIQYLEKIGAMSEVDVKKLWSSHGSLIIQERVPVEGDAVGVNLLYDAGSRCVCEFVHKRLQQYPVSGGPSTDRISIKDAHLVAESKKLLESLNWKGVAMVEWKHDPISGAKKLLEVNPRFWGSLELAVRSGADFPALYAQCAASAPVVKPSTTYKLGQRCRWLIPGDILRYMSTPSGSREPMETFFTGLPGIAEEWDSRDIRGFLSTIICTALLALQPKYWKYVR